jgi:hypothetical protein
MTGCIFINWMEANIENAWISIRNKQEIFIRLCQQDCDLMWDIDIVPTINYELTKWIDETIQELSERLKSPINY